MTTITTEQFAEHWIKKITIEKEQKQYDKDWFFDFRFTAMELPFDWNQEVFINLFKEGFPFPLKRINLDFVEGKYICFGKVEGEYKFEPFNYFKEQLNNLSQI